MVNNNNNNNNNITKSQLQTIGYYVLSKLEDNWNNYKVSPKHYDYIEYHNFWKCRFAPWFCKDVLDLFDCKKDEVLVEIARVKGDHTKDLHYHKIAHAYCIVLGSTVGLKNCKDGKVQVNKKTYKSRLNKGYYFPTNCKHTFHGGSEHDLYFISVQSPPLLTKDNDDFYLV